MTQQTIEALTRLIKHADEQIAALDGFDAKLSRAMKVVRQQLNNRRFKLSQKASKAQK